VAIPPGICVDAGIPAVLGFYVPAFDGRAFVNATAGLRDQPYGKTGDAAVDQIERGFQDGSGGRGPVHGYCGSASCCRGSSLFREAQPRVAGEQFDPAHGDGLLP
jgi:hypothetical protein